MQAFVIVRVNDVLEFVLVQVPAADPDIARAENDRSTFIPLTEPIAAH